MPVSWATRAGMRGFASMPNVTRPLQTAKMAPCRSGRLGADPLKILFLTNAHNGLSQRARGMLQAQGHTVSVELAISQKQIKAVVDDARPDVIICPFLTARVPEEIWKKGYPKPDTPVIIVHPGVQGDKGMSSIDWALKEGKPLGVTCLSAVEDMDAGPVWATREVNINRADPSTITKSSVYKNEITEAAMSAISETIDKITNGSPPLEVSDDDPSTLGTLLPTMPVKQRAIDLSADADSVAQAVRYSDGSPGAPVTLNGKKFRAFGAIADAACTVPVPPGAQPGDVIGHRNNAVAVATGDGVVFFSHLKCIKGHSKRGSIKVPAAMALQLDGAQLPELPTLKSQSNVKASESSRKWFHRPVDTYMDLWTHTTDRVCYVVSNFLNGAMSTEQCRRLEEVLKQVAARKDVDAVVIAGGYDAFSNGINLNTIEAAEAFTPISEWKLNSNDQSESWENINAIDDVIKQIFSMHDKVTISALRGGAGAGGFMMALAADRVWAHSGVVVNPHYRTMGLYGSEYWTHFLPERLGSMAEAVRITESKAAYTAQDAADLGLLDQVIAKNVEQFQQVLHTNVRQLLSEDGPEIVQRKTARTTIDYLNSLEAARTYELNTMARDFQSREYNESRRRFVFKEKAMATPVHMSDRRGVVIDGKALGRKIRERIKTNLVEELAELPEGTTPPGLGIIQVGDMPDSTLYVNMKIKFAKTAGMNGQVVTIPERCPRDQGAVDMTYAAVADQIRAWNEDPAVDGIMVQNPIPGFDTETSYKLFHTIKPEKDVDCLNPGNFHSFLVGTSELSDDLSGIFLPPCPLAIIEMLIAYQVPLKGKFATVIGTSPNLGLPVASLLTNEGCSVQSVNLQSTQVLGTSLKHADIIVAAANMANVVKPDMVKPGAVIIDAGICAHPTTGELCGAVDEKCSTVAKMMSPVPGGVGPATVAMLLKNVWLSWNEKHKRARSGKFAGEVEQPAADIAA